MIFERFAITVLAIFVLLAWAALTFVEKPARLRHEAALKLICHNLEQEFHEQNDHVPMDYNLDCDTLKPL